MGVPRRTFQGGRMFRKALALLWVVLLYALVACGATATPAPATVPPPAADFEWSWKRQMTHETKSRYAQALWPIKGAEAFGTGKGKIEDVGVKATDDRTLVVTLERSAPFFLQLVATWSFFPVPRAQVE